MDTVLIAVYCDIAARHRCSVDDILCHPVYRHEYLSECHKRFGSDRGEYDILHRLSNLRKRSKIPSRKQILAGIAA